MSSYFLFAGDERYPLGGGDDFIAKFDSIEQAEVAFTKSQFFNRYGWAHIFCCNELKIVRRYYGGDWLLDGEIIVL